VTLPANVLRKVKQYIMNILTFDPSPAWQLPARFGCGDANTFDTIAAQGNTDIAHHV
jgi:hypothetical protein